MNTQNLLKIAFYVLVAIVLLSVIGKVMSIITSGWFIVGALVIWYFGFHKKSSD